MITVCLVRHAKAGDRETWEGDDRQRPLTRKGHKQADALVQTLAAFDVRRVLSSPYLRCIQTVKPLAKQRGLPVEETPALAEGADLADVFAIMHTLDGTTVLCGHGDVILTLLEMLVEQRLLRPAKVRLDKGSTWVLEWDGDQIVAAHYVEAP